MARGWTYNFTDMFVWRVDSNGNATGQLDPDSLGSPPLTSHALRVHGPISTTFPEPTFARFSSFGGGGFEGSASGGVTELGAGEIPLSQLNPAVINLARGGNIDVTTILGGPEIYAENVLQTSPFELGMMFVGRKQKLGSVKKNIYWQVVYPLVTCTFRKSNLTQGSGQNTQPHVLGFDPVVATKFPWGEAYGVNQNWYNYSEVSFMIDSDYPYALTAFVADGVATSFISEFKPQNSDVTSGKTKNVTAKAGVPTAMTSISITTGVHTLATAGSSGDRWVSFYQAQRGYPTV